MGHILLDLADATYLGRLQRQYTPVLWWSSCSILKCISLAGEKGRQVWGRHADSTPGPAFTRRSNPGLSPSWSLVWQEAISDDVSVGKMSSGLVRAYVDA